MTASTTPSYLIRRRVGISAPAIALDWLRADGTLEDLTSVTGSVRFASIDEPLRAVLVKTTGVTFATGATSPSVTVNLTNGDVAALLAEWGRPLREGGHRFVGQVTTGDGREWPGELVLHLDPAQIDP